MSDAADLYGVWITGGHIAAGRWMKKNDGSQQPWFGPFDEATDAAGERTRVHGPHGLRYTVKQKPEDAAS